MGYFLFLLTSVAQASTPKVIPLVATDTTQYILAWFSESEERAMWVAMFLLFVGREVYGFIKIKFGKVGVQLEALKDVPKRLDKMEENHEELIEELKQISKSFNRFHREIDERIRDEVRYAMDLSDRKG